MLIPAGRTYPVFTARPTPVATGRAAVERIRPDVMARIAGSITPSPDAAGVVSLSELVSERVRKAGFLHQAINVRVRCDLPCGDVVVTAQRRQVESALVAILRGTAAAAEISHAAVDVLVRVRRDATHGLLQVVEHTTGFSAAHMASIFNLNFARTVNREAAEGVAAFRELSEQLRDTLETYYEPGVGATFSLRWPLEPEE
ncbi:MAG: hypothetical protein P3B98_02345 [Gemmatimonadota bacterium]|nr:hypothetical protein [Gemmatimonadota bacterium]